MAEKPTYSELERKIKKLEKEALEYLRREREFNADRKLVDYGHLKRTISLMKINDELNKEIKEIKSADKKELGQISHKLRGRIKELNCLYDISSFRKGNDFSLDSLLQEIGAIVESISRIVEREWAETEIRKCRKKIEELIKQTQ